MEKIITLDQKQLERFEKLDTVNIMIHLLFFQTSII